MRMRAFTRVLTAVTCGLLGMAGGFLVAGFLFVSLHGNSGFFGMGWYYGILGAPPGLIGGAWAGLWLTRPPSPRCAGCGRPTLPDQSTCASCGWPRGGLN